MKRIFRPALALLLGTSLSLSLTACDYSYTPGINNIRTSFSNPPGWRNEDVNRDSINGEQDTYKPIGVGSATAIREGSVQEKINSAPTGGVTEGNDDQVTTRAEQEADN